ncbi:MAG: hypothetical protein D6772_09985 [Bacteroidetes bacterium]|nr:MAG: hypothetical protein D6772_09985 [Bacteroidota bacterium]
MNTPRETVWQLIQRLTPAEKRYFKRHFGRSNSRLIKLFDLLNAQASYDEESSKKILGLTAAHYKVVKTQLQERLLRSLVIGQGKRSLRTKITIGLQEVDVLLERELFAEATRRLRRLDQVCAQYGFTLYRYEITEKLQAVTHLESEVQDEDTQSYYEQLDHLLCTLNQKQQLHAIQMELEAWTPFAPGRFAFGQRILRQLEDMPAQYLDFQSQLEWMQNVALCHEILGQAEEALRYRRQILDNFARDASLRERLPFHYLRALRYQVAPLTRDSQVQNLSANLEAARHLISRFPQYSPHLVYFYWAEIRSHFIHYQWARITGGLEVRTCQHLATYRLGAYSITTDIYLVLACTHIIQGNQEQAQAYLNQLESAKPTLHLHHPLSLSILQLVRCWEQQKLDELARILRNHQRRLRRHGILEQSPLAIALFKLFRELVKRPAEHQSLAASFLLELSAHSQDVLLPYFSFMHLERWLQAVAGKLQWAQTFKTK